MIRGMICLLSFTVLVLCIEVIPIWTSIILLAIFGITSIKYWDKETKRAVRNFILKGAK